METIHPQKWRDTIDPFSLPYHSFQPLKVLGYPHAGNDVFHVRGIHIGRECAAYIKVARQQGSSIKNETAILRQLHSPIIPRLLDADYGEHPFSVTSEMPGARLSVILGDNDDMRSLEYMEEYGEALGCIHRLAISAEPVADRRFFHSPSVEMLEKTSLSHLSSYFASPPSNTETVFCHGDFHYANLLWQDSHISGILDFELSGYGNRDFDIAWALILRPGQKFLKTRAEQQLFLNGYAKHGQYSTQNVQYYMAQIYVYFLSFSGDDAEYCRYVRAWLEENCNP